MKKRIALHAMLALLLVVISVQCVPSTAQESRTRKSDNDLSSYLGQWTFDFGERAVGWLNIRQEEGYLDADLMWGGGGIAYGLPYVFVTEGKLIVGRNTRNAVITRNDEGDPEITRNYPTWIELTREGDKISGYYLSPRIDGNGLDSVYIEGQRVPEIPPVPDLANAEYGTPVSLIPDPNELTGWRMLEENLVNGWSMRNGVLSNNPEQVEGKDHIHYGNLRTEDEYEDFNITLEVNTPPGSNSGVYLRGMYEVQVADSYDRPLNWGGSMGAIFTRITPSIKAELPAGEWQELDITLYKRHVTVKLNGETIIDNQPVHGPTGGAMQSDVTAPGPIYLQGDHTEIAYRNIVLTPIIQ